MTKRKASTVIVEVEERQKQLPPVVLKSKRDKNDVIFLIQESLSCDDEESVIENLLLIDISTAVPSFYEVMELIKQLWKKYQNKLTVCTIVINLLTKLLPLITNLSHDHQMFVSSLIAHSSSDIKSLVLKCWVNVSDKFSAELITQCLKETVEIVYSSSHVLRMECLNLIGHFSVMSPSGGDALLLLVIEFCYDLDPRVRKQALKSLLKMHDAGMVLDISTYTKVCELLQDEDESVRCIAMKLIHSLGLSLSESTISLPQDASVTMRLQDDAFIKICNMVTDGSIQVRSLAASLLGKFSCISDQFLLQTLDKKLMSHLRVVKSDHERQRELHYLGGGATKRWDTGKHWGSEIPSIDPAEMTLMNSGSCGAFVHCIEDEYMEVRLSAVVSIGHLSGLSTQFGIQSLDFLIDMINDEIQSVRLLAITTLRKVSASINLREDQLETILGVLQESSLEIREALHSLLASSHVTSKSGLHIVVYSLLDNLKKYPTDRLSIWSCLKSLGASHSHLVSILAPELLSTHPYYMGKEPDINDTAYICILILVFNAASGSPTLTPLFPSHVFRHYSCLRDSLPNLIPPIKMLTEQSSVPRQPATPIPSENYLKQLFSKAMSLAVSHDPSVTMTTLKQCCNDLTKLSNVEPTLKGCALFSSQLLYCQILMNKITQMLSNSVIGSTDVSGISINIRELTLLSYRLQWGFINQTPSLLSLLYCLRIYAHSVLLLLVTRLDWAVDNNNKFNELKQGLVDRLSNFAKFSIENDVVCPLYIQSLLHKDLVVMATDQLSLILQNVTSSISVISNIQFSDILLVHQCKATFDNSDHFSKDTPFTFLSSLALSVPIIATLEYLNDVKSISLQIKFPDDRMLLFTPKAEDIRSVSSTTVQLTHTLILSHGNWSDSSVIQLALLRHYVPDIKNEDHMMTLIIKLIKKGEECHAISASGDTVGKVIVSERAKMNILPQDTLSKGFNVFGPN